MVDPIGLAGRLYPRTNGQVAEMLYALECGLRELIIDVLGHNFGPLWYNSRLPGDVLDKYRRGKTSEFETKWTQHVPHHPIYYIDFPDLAKVVQHNA